MCGKTFITPGQYENFLAGKRKCAICWQPGPLTVFQLVDKAVADLAWNDLRGVLCGVGSVRQGVD